jgi:hypothetical protein
MSRDDNRKAASQLPAAQPSPIASAARERPSDDVQEGAERESRCRPPGSRNKATLLIEKLLDDDAKKIAEKAIELAKSGDSTALRLCLDRIAPTRKDRHIAFKLPKMESPEHAVKAAAAIVEAVAGAELTPSEAAEMMKLVEGYTRKGAR